MFKLHGWCHSATTKSTMFMVNKGIHKYPSKHFTKEHHEVVVILPKAHAQSRGDSEVMTCEHGT
jgi:hypothetical protein